MQYKFLCLSTGFCFFSLAVLFVSYVGNQYLVKLHIDHKQSCISFGSLFSDMGHDTRSGLQPSNWLHLPLILALLYLIHQLNETPFFDFGHKNACCVNVLFPRWTTSSYGAGFFCRPSQEQWNTPNHNSQPVEQMQKRL